MPDEALTRILYVEDEPDIQAVARLALEQVGGFTLEVCSSGSEAIAKADALLVRSATQVTDSLMAKAPRLRVIGRAGIGVDNIDLDAAQRCHVRARCNHNRLAVDGLLAAVF